MKTYWRLPRGVDELLPPAAWELELLRRKLLDVYVSWGFEYVEPPVIEYLESLLVGSGEDLDLQTLKVVDQVSGKQLGVRADMTSQAVRIDAHSLVTEDVQRLCYAGPVVFANPQIAQSSRVPFKAGAEIFGAPSLAADAEVISLMLETMAVAEVKEPVLLIGHMGIYRGLVNGLIEAGSLSSEDERELFNALQRKSQADVRALLDDSPLAEMMICLPNLMGDAAMLHTAREQLSRAPEPVLTAIDELEQLAQRVGDLNGGVKVRLDVAELSGYGYHNGPVFAVYHPQHGSALAQGGRYDGVGEVFGRPRPATGFDVNLKTLIANPRGLDIVFAPYVEGEAAKAQQIEVQRLRGQGQRIRCALTAAEEIPAGCQRTLAHSDGQWHIVAVAAPDS
jgi:ATP phosphoribosyltransferase regulatory subunit